MGRRLKTIAVCAVLLPTVTAGYLWSAWSPGAPPYDGAQLDGIELPFRLRSGPEHDAARKRVGEPYILEISTQDGSLLYYGARHSRDTGDPQMVDIRGRWNDYRPTVALCEGRSRGYFLGIPFELASGLPEPALVHKLARRDGIPIYSLEPAYAEEVASLLEDYIPAHVALYFTMRVYWSEAGGVADEALAMHLLRKRTNVDGLRDSIQSIADIDAVWSRDFAHLPDWRTMRGEPETSILADISNASRRVRGEHMARTLIDLARRDERVFAVVGSGHVIRQEWAIRAALGAPPVGDEPLDMVRR